MAVTNNLRVHELDLPENLCQGMFLEMSLYWKESLGKTFSGESYSPFLGGKKFSPG